MFALFNAFASIALSIFEHLLGTTLLSLIYALAVAVPSIAVSVRRLHDTNRSGWWVLIALIPIIGTIAMIIFAALEGDECENKYGPNPKKAG
ncbi:hypothetical protein N481_19115 [Pseudoalteromonas luteoviolacea S4047-1]|uniref:Aminopeptidase C n=2 Tax=Pseudoalteromonas luteoviolacea TaxID=43657 RepID=A0A0F6AEB5_9GAMM|nr:hypothetical protein N479_08305 [Pseudoalteromonas luteoviolacea S4054]KZN71298.1 hypothetical protein N481_19115 [Pseudoalteromonas luteoviolacea S4047-1]